MTLRTYSICMAIVAAYLLIGHFLPTPESML